MKINLNDRVAVRLTERGIVVYNRHYINTPNAILISYNPEVIFNFQLWELFSIFGEFMWHGCEIPFIDNEITLVE